MVEGLVKLGLFARIDALLSGFLGRSAAVVADAAAAAARAERPAALYCLDPVMGEREGGLYVAQATARDHRSAGCLPEADILLPNAFELDYLWRRRATRTLADVAPPPRLLKNARARCGGDRHRPRSRGRAR